VLSNKKSALENIIGSKNQLFRIEKADSWFPLKNIDSKTPNNISKTAIKKNLGNFSKVIFFKTHTLANAKKIIAKTVTISKRLDGRPKMFMRSM
jgi:hypothetical protein